MIAGWVALFWSIRMKQSLRFCLLILITSLVAGEAPAVPTPASKKGLAGRVTPDKLKELKVGWYYFWAPRVPGDTPQGIDYVPMVWGLKDDPKLDNTIAGLTEKKKSGAVTTLLGFNEPDGKDQSNMTVEVALENWPKLMDTGLRLGSPAGVHADNAWMTEFMREAEKKKYRIDFITVHWYGTADPATFLAHLEKVHRLYKRPIWITEFAVADWNAGPGKPSKYSQAQVLKFMERVIPALKKLDYVERFSWFLAKAKSEKMGSSALYNEDGTLTELGKLYSTY